MAVKAPPVVAYDWNGFYIGGYYGSGVGESRSRTDPPGNPAGTRVGETNYNAQGLTLGGTFGYNWQFAPHWLVGVEGDIGTLGVDHTFKEYNDVIISGSKADWYGTIRARFGYVTGPSLLYLTGGVAFVNVTDTFGGDSISIPALAVTTTRTGWTAGLGIETKLSHNWTAKTEYLYIDAGSNTVGTDPFGVGVAPGSGGLVPTTYDQTYHVIGRA
jgi:outer membrane immunogenic protein